MADITHDAVLSAAWMLMRHAREAGSASGRSDTFGHTAEDRQNNSKAYTKEAVRQLIAAYLYTPTQITSPFHGW
jgi:hypothetical protein